MLKLQEANELGGKLLDHPEVIETHEKLTAVIHLKVPRAEIEAVMGPAIAEVLATLSAQGIAPIGALFSYHLKRPSALFDFEVGFPASSQITPIGRVVPGTLPATKVVRSIYRGGYEGLGAAWSELFEWVKSEGYLAQGSLWECYTSGPESGSDHDQWTTELNCPLK